MSYPGEPTVSYTYDAAGNRKTETRGGDTTNYDYDAAGQLVTVGNKTYTYDANGNLTQAGSDSFTWDYDNRLTQATVGTHTGSYTYDGGGVRVGATVDGSAKNYLVDTQGGLPTLVDDGSNAYLHADGVLSEVGTGDTSQLLTDALGSVRGLADGAGSLTGSRSYEAFGAPRTSTGVSSLFGFAGEPADDTSLVYLRARSLDPATGRFLSADSVMPNAPGTQGYSLYAYAANNPATWTDPTGHTSTGLTDRIGDSLEEFLNAAGVNGISGIALAGALAVPQAALPPAFFFWFVVIVIIIVLLVAVLLLQDAAGQGSSVPGTQDECTASGNVQTAVATCPDTPQVEEPAPEPKPSPMCCPYWGGGDDDEPEEGQTIYRVYGGEAGPLGRSWTPVDPRFVQNDPLLQARWGRYAYRALAGLPDPPDNNGDYMIMARLKNPGAVIPRESEEMPTKLHSSGKWPGKLPEYFFPVPPRPGIDIDLVDSNIPLVPHY